MKSAMRQIALDTETTGFDPEEGHRLVEIGCVEMVDMVRTGRTFHVYVDPERDMPESAFKVHGLSREFLRDKPKFREVADPFLEFIGEDQLVIHNAAFDMRFLNAELKKIGKPALPMERSLDTVLLARKLFPGAQVNLNALCNRFGIDLSRRTFHGALLDAELLCDVYLELNGGRQTTLLAGEVRPEKKRAEYEAFDPRQLQQMQRDFTPSPEEQAAHLAFVKKKLKNPIWAKYLNLEDA
jgi:DNA polymerase-3 subunit epsilon